MNNNNNVGSKRDFDAFTSNQIPGEKQEDELFEKILSDWQENNGRAAEKVADKAKKIVRKVYENNSNTLQINADYACPEPTLPNIFVINKFATNLKTLKVVSFNIAQSIFPSIMTYTNLRILDLQDTNMQELPDAIGDLSYI